MTNAAIVTNGYPTGKQFPERNLALHFDIPIYTIAQSGSKPNSIEVKEINIDLPPVVGQWFQDTIERLHYAFWKPPTTYDIIISSNLRTQSLVQWPDQHRIHYFHGIHRGSFGFPARDRFSNNSFVKTLQLANRAFIRALNSASFDIIDTVVANSEYTAKMIEQHYSTEVDAVIYPSFVDVSEYSNQRKESDVDYYLYVGRLADEKGINQIIGAFNELELPLRIAGRGPVKSELEDRAKDNIDLLGYVSEQKKRELLSNCKGFIHNTMGEPFGVVLVEALASGAPIIGVEAGNIPYLVKENETGVLFQRENNGTTFQRPQSTAPLINALQKAESIDWDYDHICTEAEKYDKNNIFEKWGQLLDGLE